jgi:transmembrane sensor
MTRDMTSLPTQLIDEAAEWFIVMRDESVTPEERTAFSQWLCLSPQHVRAYLETAALWGEAAHLPPEPSLEIVGSDDLGNVVPLRPARAPVVRTAPARAAPMRLRLAAGVAAFALMAAAGWLLTRGEVLSTELGEQRLVTLEDGSTVRLNARSKVSARMSSRRREIELIEGQALFEVAKDTERPFVVRSGGLAVSAVGTAFDVNQRQRGTVVTVIEGRVLLDARKSVPEQGIARAPASGAIAMSAGEQAVVDRGGAVDMSVAANLSAATSWIHNLLVFEETPLDTVVEELNRYSRRQIVLEDASLATLRINAVLQSANPEALLRYLERTQRVRIAITSSAIKISRSQVPTSAAATLLPSEQ